MTPAPPLALITDAAGARLPVETVLDAALAAGCRWIVVRDKEMPPDARRLLIETAIARGAACGAAVLVAGDPALARRSGAAGVHLPDGGSVAEARRLMGAEALVGVSTHSPEDVGRAARDGADYVTLSPIFPTDSKPGYGPALGLDALGRACRAPIPVIALAGITPANAAACRAAGAAGIAVMGSVMRAPDPARVVAELVEAVTPAVQAGLGGAEPTR